MKNLGAGSLVHRTSWMQDKKAWTLFQDPCFPKYARDSSCDFRGYKDGHILIVTHSFKEL